MQNDGSYLLICCYNYHIRKTIDIHRCVSITADEKKNVENFLLNLGVSSSVFSPPPSSPHCSPSCVLSSAPIPFSYTSILSRSLLQLLLTLPLPTSSHCSHLQYIGLVTHPQDTTRPLHCLPPHWETDCPGRQQEVEDWICGGGRGGECGRGRGGGDAHSRG